MGVSSSLSSSSLNDNSIMRKFSRSGEPLNIDFLDNDDLSDKIIEIKRIKIPLFENKHLQTLSNIVYVTGNSPFHEGLIIETQQNQFYITQTYPITFHKAFSIKDAIKRIKDFCASNRNAKKYQIRDIWVFKNDCYIKDIINIIKKLPNRYDIINQNCQTYCNSILKQLPLKKIQTNDIINNF